MSKRQRQKHQAPHNMLKGKTFLAALFLLSLSTISTAYAGWEQQGSDWYYFDDRGQYRTGDYMDTDGNIYFFDHTGRMISDTFTSYGRYYSTSGELINISSDITGNNRSLSERYLAGETLIFPDTESLAQWWLYFNLYYNDFVLNEKLPVKEITPGAVTTETFIEYRERVSWPTTPVNRTTSELVQSTVHKLSEQVTGTTIEEKSRSAAKVVANYIDYDYDLRNSNDDLIYGLESILKRRKAICQGYAMLTVRVLREIGIDAEIVQGTVIEPEGETIGHAWVRVNTLQDEDDDPIGTQEVYWLYIDPTAYDTCKTEEDKQQSLDLRSSDYALNWKMRGQLFHADTFYGSFVNIY